MLSGQKRSFHSMNINCEVLTVFFSGRFYHGKIKLNYFIESVPYTDSNMLIEVQKKISLLDHLIWSLKWSLPSRSSPQ